jgi:hypothetical protein
MARQQRQQRRLPSMSKLNSRPNTISRNMKLSETNVNSNNRCSAFERVTTVTIPVASTPGQLLYTLLNNPNSAPRSNAISSQYDSWYGVTSVSVETTGNALSKNFIIIRHVPNGDPARLPNPGNSLLNFAEASSRRDESVKLQLDSNRQATCTAPWAATSYNRRKPINDTDPSDANNGLFSIVSNGSPGNDPVDITIRYRYDFHFYGPIYVPIISNHSAALTSNTPTIGAPFANPIVDGESISDVTNDTFTLAPGQYLLTTYATGTGIAALIAPTAPSQPAGAGSFNATSSCHRVAWNVVASTLVTLTPVATTLSVINIIISMNNPV